jgi:hypothetical protein
VGSDSNETTPISILQNNQGRTRKIDEKSKVVTRLLESHLLESRLLEPRLLESRLLEIPFVGKVFTAYPNF